MRLNPHLQFDGQCEAAFKSYEEYLGGKIVMTMTYGESPVGEQMQTECRKKILDTTLAVGNYLLQGADIHPETYQRPQGFSGMLNIEDAAKAERIFNNPQQPVAERSGANARAGDVLGDALWHARWLVDQFGTPWTVDCEKPR